MSQNLYLEDISDDMEIPTIKKNPTTQQLVKYAGASGDFYQIHYDMDYAKNNGLPGVILHGALKNALLAQLLTDWIGPLGKLNKLEVQYRGIMGGHKPKGILCRKLQSGGPAGWRGRGTGRVAVQAIEFYR